jgi:hypothetical protein
MPGDSCLQGTSNSSFSTTKHRLQRVLLGCFAQELERTASPKGLATGACLFTGFKRWEPLFVEMHTSEVDPYLIYLPKDNSSDEYDACVLFQHAFVVYVNDI